MYQWVSMIVLFVFVLDTMITMQMTYIHPSPSWCYYIGAYLDVCSTLPVWCLRNVLFRWNGWCGRGMMAWAYTKKLVPTWIVRLHLRRIFFLEAPVKVPPVSWELKYLEVQVSSRPLCVCMVYKDKIFTLWSMTSSVKKNRCSNVLASILFFLFHVGLWMRSYQKTDRGYGEIVSQSQGSKHAQTMDSLSC